MGADVVQANYDELESVASRFKSQVEANAELYSRIENCFQALEKDWEGKGANAFFSEMKSKIFPAMQRLTSALEQAHTVTLEVKEIIEQMEEEAAAPFRRGQHHGVLYASLGAPNTVFAWPSGLPVVASPTADAYVIKKKDLKRFYFKVHGDGECAAIVQTHFGKRLGRTREWRSGVSLMEKPELEYGTVIATFDQNDGYPNKKHGNHVAIFLYYVDKNDKPVDNEDSKVAGIRVLDQYGGEVADERTLEFLPEEEAKKKRPPPSPHNGGLLVNQANDMHVVTNPSKQPTSP
jgi:WXG100 family type VII secretion target